MSGLRRLGSSEPLRLAVAVALAAGAVVLGESLLRGGGHHHGSSQRPGQAALAAGGPAGAVGSAAASSSRAGGSVSGLAGASGSPSGPVLVAGGPAVTRALRHGSMTVVVDRPSSGVFSEQNRSIARGEATAVAELNAAGGLAHHIRITLVSQSLDGLSPAALQRQLRSEAAAILILPCDTDSQLGLASAAAQFGMLMLAPCNPDPAAGQRYPTYWPVGMGANEEASGLVNFMSRFAYRSAFVVSAPGSRFVELMTSYFRRAAQAGGIRLVGSASIAMDSRDFSGLAHSIETTNPQPSVIYTAFPPPFANRLGAALRAQGISHPLVGTTAMDTRASLSGDAEALENAFFPSYGFPREDALARRFADDYRRRFRSEPAGGFPGLGLEAIRLLEDAVRKARSAEPRAIQQALAGGITLRGVGLEDRSYQAGGDHNPTGLVAITKIASGALLPLNAATPSSLSP
jgi:branched-chain amino acid transport system substrate-binding protein